MVVRCVVVLFAAVMTACSSGEAGGHPPSVVPVETTLTSAPGPLGSCEGRDREVFLGFPHIGPVGDGVTYSGKPGVVCEAYIGTLWTVEKERGYYRSRLRARGWDVVLDEEGLPNRSSPNVLVGRKGSYYLIVHNGGDDGLIGLSLCDPARLGDAERDCGTGLGPLP